MHLPAETYSATLKMTKWSSVEIETVNAASVSVCRRRIDELVTARVVQSMGIVLVTSNFIISRFPDPESYPSQRYYEGVLEEDKVFMGRYKNNLWVR